MEVAKRPKIVKPLGKLNNTLFDDLGFNFLGFPNRLSWLKKHVGGDVKRLN